MVLKNKKVENKATNINKPEKIKESFLVIQLSSFQLKNTSGLPPKSIILLFVERQLSLFIKIPFLNRIQ